MNYSNLEMLYAMHVLEGKITDINTIPSVLRDNVMEIVNNAKKKDDGSTPAE